MTKFKKKNRTRKNNKLIKSSKKNKKNRIDTKRKTKRNKKIKRRKKITKKNKMKGGMMGTILASHMTRQSPDTQLSPAVSGSSQSDRAPAPLGEMSIFGISKMSDYFRRWDKRYAEIRGGHLLFYKDLDSQSPTSIKDLEAVKGYRTTKGSLFLENDISKTDQLHVERIKKEDGVILGKTNVPEFGASGGTENKLGDDCRNPWNLNHTSGGSSGGTAAAVASGVHPFGQGSDGGGSIRIPSSFSGIYGIKGTQGRVPRRHSGKMSWHPVNYSCVGPMSWFVKDSALLLQVMSGTHIEAEPNTIEKPSPDYLKHIDNGVKGKKIGWSQNLNTRIADQEVIDINAKALKLLENNGAIIEDLDLFISKFLFFN